MQLTKEALEARFQAKRQELQQIEENARSLEQQLGNCRLEAQKVLGQLQTLQELYSEVEDEETDQPIEVLELDNSQKQDRASELISQVD